MLLGEEPHPPYERPPLSKAVLLGEREPEQCLLAPPQEYAELGIELKPGTRITSISTDTQIVQPESGDALEYDKLVIATGGVCRRFPGQGGGLDGVFDLRTLDHSLAIRQRLQPGSEVVIVGGGFIGLETAASAVARDCKVHVVEMANSLLGRALPAEAAAVVAGIHEDAGVQFHMGCYVSSFHGEGRLDSAMLSDGSVIAADLAVVGIGILPADRLAKEAGLGVDDGIVTDSCCRTSIPDIYAIGDCARSRNDRYHEHIRLESWQNAEQQAEVVADHITGTEKPLQSVPWFWTDQYDYNIQMAGFTHLAETTAIRGDLDQGQVLFFGITAESLVSAVAIGQGTKAARELRICQMLIERGMRIDPESLVDPLTNLKSLLKQG